jgi:heat shock protein HslJ
MPTPIKLNVYKCIVFAGMIFFSLLSSCGGSKLSSGSIQSGPEGSYRVISLDQTPLRDTQPSMILDLNQARVSGNSGCNDYSAALVMDKNTSDEIRMDSVMTTKMYCDDQVMAVEYLFLGNMTKAQRWSQSGDTLYLSNAEGTNILIAVKTQSQ